MMTWFKHLCLGALLSAVLPLTATADAQESFPRKFRNPLGMDFVLIPAGPFRFGYSASLGDQSGEVIQRDYLVWLRQPYYLQTTEVTQGQWQALMGRSPCERETCPTPGPDYPVRNVQVSEISTFIQRLNQSEGKAYRLPTRPEWEHAARAGSWQTRYWWGADPKPLIQTDNCRAPGDHGWPGLARDGYAGLAPVARFQPNPWGLYDMQGNVSELLVHATLLWSGYRLDPVRHFSNDPSSYLQAYTDFPRDSLPDYPYRDAAGGNYRAAADGCQLSSGSGLLLDTPGAALDSGNTRSQTVGFRLLLPASALR